MDEGAPTVVITYETLFELVRREKGRGELQQLDSDFFRNTIEYLAQKKEILKDSSDDDMFGDSEQTLNQINHIKKLIRKLYETREKKLVDMALMRSKTGRSPGDEEFILPEEEMFYNDVIMVLDKAREQVLKRVVLGKLPLTTPEKKSTPSPSAVEEQDTEVSVQFLEDTEAFAGEDMQMYGPYAKDATEQLPSKMADMLVKRGSVSIIKE